MIVARLGACKSKAGLRMQRPPKYLVDLANLQWKILVVGKDILRATNGSLAPSGMSHPFWKMLTSMRDLVPKGTRITLILSRGTIVKDAYDF